MKKPVICIMLIAILSFVVFSDSVSFAEAKNSDRPAMSFSNGTEISCGLGSVLIFGGDKVVAEAVEINRGSKGKDLTHGWAYCTDVDNGNITTITVSVKQ